MADNTISTEEKGECKKCKSNILKRADRCPKCGYEPGNSLISKGIYWLITLPWTLVFVLLFLVGIAGTLIGEISLGEFLGVVVGLGILGALPFWHVSRYTKRKKMSATGDIEEEDIGKYGALGGRIGEKMKKGFRSPFGRD